MEHAIAHVHVQARGFKLVDAVEIVERGSADGGLVVDDVFKIVEQHFAFPCLLRHIGGFVGVFMHDEEAVENPCSVQFFCSRERFVRIVFHV